MTDKINITPEIEKYINQSVLCWLAASSPENIPNVSPKEVFTYFGGDSVIVANIASPQTVENIKQNNNVCVSFIDILIQKGYQIKGTAEIIKYSEPDFAEMEKKLLQITKGEFPFSTIIKITITSSKMIIAPSYSLYPETTEEQQIKSAKKAYGI